MKSFITSVATLSSALGLCAGAPPGDQIEKIEREVLQRVEAQVEDVQEQIQQIGADSWKQAQKALQLAQRTQAGVDDAAAGWDFQFQQLGDKFTTWVGAPGRAASRPLIVLGAGADPVVATDLREDLMVMSRLLTKAADHQGGQEEPAWVMGIVVSKLGGPASPQSFYLDGHGAMFLVNVKFPLVAPPNPPLEETKPGKEVDTAWEDTKQELFGKSEMLASRKKASKAKAEFNEQRVADLRKDLLESLKSAKNIRHLKAEDWITVVVTGGDGSAGSDVKKVTRMEAPRATTSRSGAIATVKAVNFQGDGQSTEENSQLVIRVRKADADAFANGKLALEDFEKKAQIAAY